MRLRLLETVIPMSMSNTHTSKHTQGTDTQESTVTTTSSDKDDREQGERAKAHSNQPWQRQVTTKNTGSVSIGTAPHQMTTRRQSHRRRPNIRSTCVCTQCGDDGPSHVVCAGTTWYQVVLATTTTMIIVTSLVGLCCLLFGSTTVSAIQRECSFIHSTTHSHRPARTKRQPPIELYADAKQTFVLPIFPLRRSVKVPTETLSLNLYEERYLALAERILLDPRRIFGALYSSDKPQLVAGGNGPIVPLFEPGDVGAICRVYRDQEGMIPTGQDGYERRRIKLDAIAVGRFRIERILHDGSVAMDMTRQNTNDDENDGDHRNNRNDSNDNHGEEEEPLPYIVVEASVVEDRIIRGNRISEAETKLDGILANKADFLQREQPWFSLEESINERTFAPNNIVNGELEELCRLFVWDDDNDSQTNTGATGKNLAEKDPEALRRILFSLGGLASLPSTVSPMKLVELLKTTSTLERLETVAKLFEEEPSWFKFFSTK